MRDAPLVRGQQLPELQLGAEHRVAVLEDRVHRAIEVRVQILLTGQVRQMLNRRGDVQVLLRLVYLQRNDSQVLAFKCYQAPLEHVVDKVRLPLHKVDALMEKLQRGHSRLGSAEFSNQLNDDTHSSWQPSRRELRIKWWPVMHKVPSTGPFDDDVECNMTPSSFGVVISSANSILQMQPRGIGNAASHRHSRLLNLKRPFGRTRWRKH